MGLCHALHLLQYIVSNRTNTPSASAASEAGVDAEGFRADKAIIVAAIHRGWTAAAAAAAAAAARSIGCDNQAREATPQLLNFDTEKQFSGLNKLKIPRAVEQRELQ
jgi:hypothetical protein